VTITELRRFSAVAFGNQYRLELLAALALADADQGICLTLLGDCCEVRPSVYYPPVKAMAVAGLVQTTGRVRSDRRVLYARNPGPAWAGLRRMVEDLPVDVDLGDAALDWPAAA
jgi:hypothetical protein